jgi:hypothetical protein
MLSTTSIANSFKTVIVMMLTLYSQVTSLGQQPVATSVSGVSHTCGNLVFTVPEGWTVLANGENYSIFLPPKYNDPDRWVNIAIFKGTVSTGNIQADFDNAWKKFLGNYTKYQEPYLLKEKSIKGYDILRGGTNVRKGEETPLYAHLWVAKVKDQVETVLVVAHHSTDFDITVNPEIKPFWAKLQFKNLPETSGNYSLRGNGVQGIYSGLQSGMRVTGEVAKNISFLIIYNDGKLKSTSRLPDNGFNVFDREVDREINAGYWGDYDLKKRTVVFDKLNQPRTLGFTYRAPKVIYNEYAYTKVPNVDALVLSGVYSADKDPTAVAAFGHEPTITFFKDGRFEDNTALYYVKTSNEMFKNPGKGRYRINNFTIDLIYDDGRGKASFSFITWDSTNHSSIQIADNILLKK